jgi:hypothetical protein
VARMRKQRPAESEEEFQFKLLRLLMCKRWDFV